MENLEPRILFSAAPATNVDMDQPGPNVVVDPGVSPAPSAAAIDDPTTNGTGNQVNSDNTAVAQSTSGARPDPNNSDDQTLPNEEMIGEQIDFSITFDNTGTQEGFAPYMDIVVPSGIDLDLTASTNVGGLGLDVLPMAKLIELDAADLARYQADVTAGTADASWAAQLGIDGTTGGTTRFWVRANSPLTSGADVDFTAPFLPPADAVFFTGNSGRLLGTDDGTTQVVGAHMIEHPILTSLNVQNSGLPQFGAVSAYNPALADGDVLYTIQFPFGSFTPGQPPIELAFSGELDIAGGATVDQTMFVRSYGGFALGLDALNNASPTDDPPIGGVNAFDDVTQVFDDANNDGVPDGAGQAAYLAVDDCGGGVGSDYITPKVLEVKKDEAADAHEHATGPSQVKTFRIDVDVAEGQTLEDLLITDVLPDNMVFVPNSVQIQINGNAVGSGLQVFQPWEINPGTGYDGAIAAGSQLFRMENEDFPNIPGGVLQVAFDDFTADSLPGEDDFRLYSGGEVQGDGGRWDITIEYQAYAPEFYEAPSDGAGGVLDAAAFAALTPAQREQAYFADRIVDTSKGDNGRIFHEGDNEGPGTSPADSSLQDPGDNAVNDVRADASFDINGDGTIDGLDLVDTTGDGFGDTGGGRVFDDDSGTGAAQAIAALNPNGAHVDPNQQNDVDQRVDGPEPVNGDQAGIELDPLTVEKNVFNVVKPDGTPGDGGDPSDADNPGDLVPGDYVGFDIEINVSDFYAFDNAFLEDYLGDGFEFVTAADATALGNGTVTGPQIAALFGGNAAFGTFDPITGDPLTFADFIDPFQRENLVANTANGNYAVTPNGIPINPLTGTPVGNFNAGGARFTDPASGLSGVFDHNTDVGGDLLTWNFSQFYQGDAFEGTAITGDPYDDGDRFGLFVNGDANGDGVLDAAELDFLGATGVVAAGTASTGNGLLPADDVNGDGIHDALANFFKDIDGDGVIDGIDIDGDGGATTIDIPTYIAGGLFDPVNDGDSAVTNPAATGTGNPNGANRGYHYFYEVDGGLGGGGGANGDDEWDDDLAQHVGQSFITNGTNGTRVLHEDIPEDTKIVIRFWARISDQYDFENVLQGGSGGTDAGVDLRDRLDNHTFIQGDHVLYTDADGTIPTDDGVKKFGAQGTAEALTYNSTTEEVFGINTSADELFIQNPDGTVTTVGGLFETIAGVPTPVNLPGNAGLAYDAATNTTYLTSSGAFNNLYTVDIATGELTAVGPLGVGGIQGLAVVPGVGLFGTNFSDRLFQIDTTTGATTQVGGPGATFGFNAGDTGLDFFDGALHMVNTLTNDLYQLDLTTGVATSVGTIASGGAPAIVCCPGAGIDTDGDGINDAFAPDADGDGEPGVDFDNDGTPDGPIGETYRDQGFDFVQLTRPGINKNLVGLNGESILDDDNSDVVDVVNNNSGAAGPDGNIDDPRIGVGGSVTYRLRVNLPSGSAENLSVTDFLPLPVFNLLNDYVNGAGGATFVGNQSAEGSTLVGTGPAAIDDNDLPDATIGADIEWTYGPDHFIPPNVTITNPPGAAGGSETVITAFNGAGVGNAADSYLPEVRFDTGNNEISWNFGTWEQDIDDPTYGNSSAVIDILFTVRLNNEPFADGLFLTNQAEFAYSDTTGSDAVNSIVQLETLSPNLQIRKGVLAVSPQGQPGGFSFDGNGGQGPGLYDNANEDLDNHEWAAFGENNHFNTQGVASSDTVFNSVKGAETGVALNGPAVAGAVGGAQVPFTVTTSDTQLSSAIETGAIWSELDAGPMAGPVAGTILVNGQMYNVANQHTDTDSVVNFGGGGGDFGANNGYNTISGGAGLGGNDFSVRADGFIEFTQAGTYSIAIASDDGRELTLEAGTLQPGSPFAGFTTEAGQRTGEGDPNVILFDNTTGHNRTIGIFEVAAGDILRFDGYMFERGGGDSFELSIKSGADTSYGGPGDPDGAWELLTDGGIGGTINVGTDAAASDGNIRIQAFNLGAVTPSFVLDNSTPGNFFVQNTGNKEVQLEFFQDDMMQSDQGGPGNFNLDGNARLDQVRSGNNNNNGNDVNQWVVPGSVELFAVYMTDQLDSNTSASAPDPLTDTAFSANSPTNGAGDWSVIAGDNGPEGGTFFQDPNTAGHRFVFRDLPQPDGRTGVIVDPNNTVVGHINYETGAISGAGISNGNSFGDNGYFPEGIVNLYASYDVADVLDQGENYSVSAYDDPTEVSQLVTNRPGTYQNANTVISPSISAHLAGQRILPGTVVFDIGGGADTLTDDGNGNLVQTSTGAAVGFISYTSGEYTFGLSDGGGAVPAGIPQSVELSFDFGNPLGATPFDTAGAEAAFGPADVTLGSELSFSGDVGDYNLKPGTVRVAIDDTPNQLILIDRPDASSAGGSYTGADEAVRGDLLMFDVTSGMLVTDGNGDPAVFGSINYNNGDINFQIPVVDGSAFGDAEIKIDYDRWQASEHYVTSMYLHNRSEFTDETQLTQWASFVDSDARNLDAGDVVTYGIFVENLGGSPAFEVEIFDAFFENAFEGNVRGGANDTNFNDTHLAPVTQGGITANSSAGLTNAQIQSFLDAFNFKAYLGDGTELIHGQDFVFQYQVGNNTDIGSNGGGQGNGLDFPEAAGGSASDDGFWRFVLTDADGAGGIPQIGAGRVNSEFAVNETGSNVLMLTYDVQIDQDITDGYAITNDAILASYTGIPATNTFGTPAYDAEISGLDFLPQDSDVLRDGADINMASRELNKVLLLTDQDHTGTANVTIENTSTVGGRTIMGFTDAEGTTWDYALRFDDFSDTDGLVFNGRPDNGGVALHTAIPHDYIRQLGGFGADGAISNNQGNAADEFGVKTIDLNAGTTAILSGGIQNSTSNDDTFPNTFIKMTEDSGQFRRQTTSFFHEDRVQVTGDWETEFEWTISDEDGTWSNGIAFVLHNDPAGANAIGNQTGDIGFDGNNAARIANAFAVSFEFNGDFGQIRINENGGSTGGGNEPVVIDFPFFVNQSDDLRPATHPTDPGAANDLNDIQDEDTTFAVRLTYDESSRTLHGVLRDEFGHERTFSHQLEEEIGFFTQDPANPDGKAFAGLTAASDTGMALLVNNFSMKVAHGDDQHTGNYTTVNTNTRVRDGNNQDDPNNAANGVDFDNRNGADNRNVDIDRGTDVAIGEEVVYGLLVELKEGRVEDMAVYDNLPPGMEFIDFEIVTNPTAGVFGGLVNGAQIAEASSWTTTPFTESWAGGNNADWQNQVIAQFETAPGNYVAAAPGQTVNPAAGTGAIRFLFPDFIVHPDQAGNPFDPETTNAQTQDDDPSTTPLVDANGAYIGNTQTDQATSEANNIFMIAIRARVTNDVNTSTYSNDNGGSTVGGTTGIDVGAGDPDLDNVVTTVEDPNADSNGATPVPSGLYQETTNPANPLNTAYMRWGGNGFRESFTGVELDIVEPELVIEKSVYNRTRPLLDNDNDQNQGTSTTPFSEQQAGDVNGLDDSRTHDDEVALLGDTITYRFEISHDMLDQDGDGRISSADAFNLNLFDDLDDSLGLLSLGTVEGLRLINPPSYIQGTNINPITDIPDSSAANTASLTLGASVNEHVLFDGTNVFAPASGIHTGRSGGVAAFNGSVLSTDLGNNLLNLNFDRLELGDSFIVEIDVQVNSDVNLTSLNQQLNDDPDPTINTAGRDDEIDVINTATLTYYSVPEVSPWDTPAPPQNIVGETSATITEATADPGFATLANGNVTPNSVSFTINDPGGAITITDDGNGNLLDGATVVGFINYANGQIAFTTAVNTGAGPFTIGSENSAGIQTASDQTGSFGLNNDNVEPNSLVITVGPGTINETFEDDGAGNLVDTDGSFTGTPGTIVGTVNYATGNVTFTQDVNTISTGPVTMNETSPALDTAADGVMPTDTYTVANGPILPGSLTVTSGFGSANVPLTDDGMGGLFDSSGGATGLPGTQVGTIDYTTGVITFTTDVNNFPSAATLETNAALVTATDTSGTYTVGGFPIFAGTVQVRIDPTGTNTPLDDDGLGNLVDTTGVITGTAGTVVGSINYNTGDVTFNQDVNPNLPGDPPFDASITYSGVENRPVAATYTTEEFHQVRARYDYRDPFAVTVDYQSSQTATNEEARQYSESDQAFLAVVQPDINLNLVKGVFGIQSAFPLNFVDGANTEDDVPSPPAGTDPFDGFDPNSGNFGTFFNFGGAGTVPGTQTAALADIQDNINGAPYTDTLTNAQDIVQGTVRLEVQSRLNQHHVTNNGASPRVETLVDLGGANAGTSIAGNPAGFLYLEGDETHTPVGTIDYVNGALQLFNTLFNQENEAVSVDYEFTREFSDRNPNPNTNNDRELSNAVATITGESAVDAAQADLAAANGDLTGGRFRHTLIHQDEALVDGSAPDAVDIANVRVRVQDADGEYFLIDNGSGSFGGTVQDASGAVIAGMSITASAIDYTWAAGGYEFTTVENHQIISANWQETVPPGAGIQNISSDWLHPELDPTLPHGLDECEWNEHVNQDLRLPDQQLRNGDVVTYGIVVENLGSQAAYDLTINDAFFDGLGLATPQNWNGNFYDVTNSLASVNFQVVRGDGQLVDFTAAYNAFTGDIEITFDDDVDGVGPSEGVLQAGTSAFGGQVDNFDGTNVLVVTYDVTIGTINTGQIYTGTNQASVSEYSFTDGGVDISGADDKLTDEAIVEFEGVFVPDPVVPEVPGVRRIEEPDDPAVIAEEFQLFGGAIFEGFRFAEESGILGSSDEDELNEPILTLMPIYSGTADPGTVLSIEIFGEFGESLPNGQQTVVTDAGGNWLAKFGGLVLTNEPHIIVIKQTAATWDSGESDHGYNLRTYFAPTISPSHVQSESHGVDSVMGRRLIPVIMDSMADNSVYSDNNTDWRLRNFEHLSASGIAGVLN